ncbi:MAG: hypothetical protein E7368_02050 [Clostridiales bacterium]|nr:hypothetical protein [Clostridiales bacterium]
MKKTEKLIVAILTITLGILLIAFQENVVKTAVVAVGVGFIALAFLDFINKSLPLAIVKAVCGVVIILFGLFAVRAVLYLISAILLIAGILLLYERLKSRNYCETLYERVISYALPTLCILIGILFLFNGGNEVTWVFVVGGIFVVVEGALVLVDAVLAD